MLLVMFLLALFYGDLPMSKSKFLFEIVLASLFSFVGIWQNRVRIELLAHLHSKNATLEAK